MAEGGTCLGRAALALLALAAPGAVPGAGARAQVDEFRNEAVLVSARSPWPARLDKGYLPIFVEVENRGDAVRDVDIEAENPFPQARHSVRARLRVEPGERRELELFAPVSATTASTYQVRFGLAGAGERTLSGVGATLWPQVGGTAPLREVMLFTREAPDPADVTAWTTDLSWVPTGTSPILRSATPIPTLGGVVEISGSGPIGPGPSGSSPNDNVQLVAARYNDLPRAPQAFTSLDAVVLELGRDPPAAARLEGLFTWVRQGGTLFVLGERADRAGELPELAPWLEPRFRESSGAVDTYAVGLGRVSLGAPAELLAVPAERTAVRAALMEPAGWVPDLSGSWWQAPGGDPVSSRRLPLPGIPSLDEFPYRAFTLLLILFAVLIGPLNFAVVKKLGRPQLLLVTIPAIALASATAVLGYGILYQGIDVKSASLTLSVLDQRERRATTVEERLFFAGRSPGPGLVPAAGTTVLPAVRRHYRMPDGSMRASPARENRLEVTLDQGVLLAGDYLPVRRRARQVVLSDRSARLRLAVERTDTGIRVTNGLEARIGELDLCDPDGRLHRLEDVLEPGASALLVPVSSSGESWTPGLQHGLAEGSIPPATFAARLDRNPFRDDCGLEPNEQSGDHRLLGILDPADEGWR